MMADKFASLRADIPDGVVVSGDSEYETLIQRWSNVAVKRPAVISLPTTAEQVSAAVKHAKALSLPFTVSGGRHSTNPHKGSSVDGGLVIDLRRMRSVSVSEDKQTVSFGGGCDWNDVDSATAKHGLATTGGTVNHTGVGGLITGGGYGWLMGRHGLAIDCLVEVEMVLADGSIVVASEDENADLFWAVRGAGTSFGVVTRFTSKVFPQGRVYSGVIALPIDKVKDIIRIGNELRETQDEDLAFFVAVTSAPPPIDSHVALVCSFYNGTQEQAEKVYAPLLALGPIMNQAREVDYSEVNGMINDFVPHGARYQLGGTYTSHPVDPDLFAEAAGEWLEWIDRSSADPSVEDTRGSNFMVEFMSLERMARVPQDATAFAARNTNYSIVIVAKSLNPENDADVRQARKKVAAMVMDKETNIVDGYNNYLDESTSAESAYGGNAERLRKLKAKFDPENRFDKLTKF